MMNLNEQHFVLTGATGGLGEALTASLSRQGCRLLLIGRNAEKLKRLAYTYKQEIYQLDFDDPFAPEKLSAYVAEHIDSPITGIINNAGISGFGLLNTIEKTSVQNVLHTNLLTPIRLTQALLPMISEAPRGFIINIGSTLGDIGYPANSIYCASKFGLRGFSEALSRELSDTDINVFYYAPRAIKTAMNDATAQRINQTLGNKEDDPESVASKIVVALKKDTEVTYVGWPEKLFVKVNRFFPKIINHAMKQQLTVIKQEISL